MESVYAKTDANGNILKDANGNTVWIRDDVNIDAEVTADLVGDYLFTDEDFIRNLSAKHQNLFQKVYAEIKYLLKAATAGSTEARKLEKVKKMFDKAYRESTEAQKNTTEDGGVRYSISNFSDQVDAVNSGTFDRSNNLFVAKTPDIYGKIGLNSDLPMLTTASHIRKAQMPKDASKHQHGLTELQIKDLPQKLEAPVIIMDSIDAARNSIIVVTDMLDPDGLPVIVSVKVDGKGQYNNVEIDSNFITSYYGRERFNNFMQANINANTLLYIDGKKATALATGPNTQWFGQLKNYSFDTIIRKTSANVNKNNKNTYSAAVATGDMATAQKLVDQAAEAAGYTVKAYHGTDADAFNVFDKGKIGTATGVSLFGDGFYFTTNKSIAQRYGKHVYPVYLKQDNVYTASDADAYRLNAIQLERKGYDGVVLHTAKGDTYMVLDPNQIKSAEPVTYDNNGKVIPLSERFNSQKEDIRYSLSTPTEDISPTGNFNIHGWDIADIDAPIRDDISVGEQLPGMRESAESGIRDQLRSSQDALNSMETVADIYVPEEYLLLDVSGKKNWVVDKLHHTGYKVDRKGFGIIEFAKKQLKSAFNYFKKGSVEETAFEALPAVLENGIEISAHTQHKGRDYGTVTIAAPITINGKRGNMAVVVKRTTGNYYKVHRILTPDGSEFILPETTNEAESTPAGELPQNGSLATPKDSASKDIIIDGREDVNTEVISDENVSEKIRIKIQNLQTELDNNQRLREESSADYDGEIARLQAEYEVWRPNGDPSYETVTKLLPRYKTPG